MKIRRLLCTAVFSSLCLMAQAAGGLSLSGAVDQAVRQYPSIRAASEEVNAAEAQVDLARTAYLPRADLLGQINRATQNNIFGLVMPQSVLPSISGPVLGTNDFTNVWGSAVGVLVSWEPFDFGLRRANVNAAQAVRSRAEAGVAVTRLEVGAAAADAFLTVLAAEQRVRAAKAGVDRAQVLVKTVNSLVNAQLRPGADASRAAAELAVAETQHIQAEQALEVSRAALADFLGVRASTLRLDPGKLLALPPAAALPSAGVAEHPIARAQNAAVAEVKARERSLERTYFPRFSFQATTYARGSGARPNGTAGGPFSGFGPNIQNWAAGMTITFPAFDFPSLNARRHIEEHRERAETARYEKTLQDLGTQLDTAKATLNGAWQVARKTPVELDAARMAERQASARFRAGLSTIVEVAEAQRLLTQAEIDDALAKLQVWRALLGQAAAQGDLKPFVDASR